MGKGEEGNESTKWNAGEGQRLESNRRGDEVETRGRVCRYERESWAHVLETCTGDEGRGAEIGG